MYLVRDKSEVTSCLKQFFTLIQTQYHKTIKTIRSDNGTEFLNTPLRQFYHNMGALIQTSCVGTPQQNGRVERKHRHILNVARSLMFQASLPVEFWGECVRTAVYLINHTPSRVLGGKSPFEILNKTPPDISHLRVFGCLCFVRNIQRPQNKFAPRSLKCMFLGYPSGTKGWRVYDLETHHFFFIRVTSRLMKRPFLLRSHIPTSSPRRPHHQSNKPTFPSLSLPRHPIQPLFLIPSKTAVRLNSQHP